jgi:hypothetical protein
MGAGHAIHRQGFRLPPSRFASLLSRAHTSSALGRLTILCGLLAALPHALAQANLTAAWQPVGPVAVSSPTYGNLTGRVTALAVDPNDATGNTVYLGATGGGVWKSTNAAGGLGSVKFAPLTDTLPVFSPNAGTGVVPSLSIGALAVQPAANPVVLAGTGDPNDATDSYYGEGLLRSADGGLTWTLVQQSNDGVSRAHSFVGLATAGIAFSTVTPTLVVAAMTVSPQAAIVAASTRASVAGLYYSTDAGATWQMATIEDGTTIVQQPQPIGTGQVGNPATAVVWDALRKQFFAAVRSHGYYSSSDGMTWTRLAIQPGTGLTSANCPVGVNGAGSTTCPIFRGALAVQPYTGDLYALTVDANNLDQGVWQDLCVASGGMCLNGTVSFATRVDGGALEVGSGSTAITQGAYDLALAAVPAAANGTLLFAGTVDLYRCSLAAGATSCTWRDTTNALDGCNAPAGVAPAQHALAGVALASGGPLLYLGNDGGLWRSLDGVAETGSVCAATDSTHFDNLNADVAAGGSLGMVNGFAQDPAATGTVLAGLGAMGSAVTTTATGAWAQMSAGEGGWPLIDPATPANWYLSIGAGVQVKACTAGSACGAANFVPPATIGSAQVGGDAALLDAPVLLDPANTALLLTGTCRVWRGPAQSGAAWTSSNALSQALDGSATPCMTTGTSASPLIRALAAGGPSSGTTPASQVVYAGMAGSLDGGAGIAGHLFVTKTANASTPAWTDTSLPNAGGFAVSSIAVDPHDATGATVYATVQGFGVGHVYRSVNFGSTWTNVSANLPNVPANAVIVDPNDANTVYAALDSGVYVTQTVSSCATSNCWSVLGTSLPNTPVVAMLSGVNLPTGDGRTGMLRAATYGRGLWQIPLLTAVSPAKPAITVAPTSLTFAAQQQGTQSAAQTVTVTSTGNAPVVFSTTAITGDFAETDSCAGKTLAVGATCTVSVVFAPTATGARSGLLTLYANISGGQATVALNGTGTTPASIVLTPLVLTFAATTVNQTTAAQTITIANTGGTAATLSAETIVQASTDFAITANTCGATLAASTACSVSIAFTPTASGARSGTFTVTDSAGTQTAQLTGTGNAPATDTLAPLSLTFSAQAIGTTSTAQTVTLTNAGDVPLTLIAASIAGSDFSVVNACGASLAGHATCSFAVSFTPTATGTRTGTLTISDQFRVQTVSLTGTGAAPAGVSLTPASLSFGVAGVGLSSAAQTLTLTNNGGLPLTIAGTVVSAGFAVASTTCGTSLAAGATCAMQVVFAPVAVGPAAGTLVLTDNAAGSPQTVNLSGTGVDFTLTANGPTSATLSSGSSATYALLFSSAAVLSGAGTVPLTCTGAPVNATCTITPSGPSLGTTVPVSVVVATGVKAGLLPGPRPFGPRSAPVLLALMLPCAWYLRRRRGLRLAALCLAMIAGVSGCGTARYIPTNSAPVTPTPTPSGTYNLTVTGNAAGLSHTVGLTLVVQ